MATRSHIAPSVPVRLSSRREAERLAALERFDILGTPPEERFDRLARLARHLFDVPVGLVTFIDDDRQWCKAALGGTFDGPREDAFCNVTIREDRVLVVEDATTHPLFEDNPYVTGDPGIRFYAGAPLVTDDGYRIGSLCAIDFEPRTITERQQEQLRDLAAIVMDELELHRERRATTRILESISNAFFALDRDWRFTYVNAQAEAVLERDRETLLGTSIWEAFPEAHGSPFQAEYEAAVAKGKTRVFEAHYPPLGRWFRVRAYPYVDGLSVYFEDVTEQRARNERLRLLESAVEHANDVVLITEAEPLDAPDGPRVVYVNPAFSKMTGYAPEDIVGKTPRLLQGGDTDRAKLDRVRAALEAWEPVVVELKNYTKAGEPLWVELSIVPVADETGWYTHWMAIQRDVTERREREMELRRAKNEAETANRLKSAFLANMSHEIRTPLTSILGFADMLAEDASPEAAADEVKPFARRIRRSGERLRDTLTAVLDLANLESQDVSLEVEPFDAAAATRALVKPWRPQAEAKGLDVHLDLPAAPLAVQADRDAFGRVLGHLLDNAVKFTDEGGVDVTVRPAPGDPSRVQVVVEDTGCGIGDGFMPHLFDAFRQESTGMRRRHEGSGLGLTIAERLTNLMGGHLAVRTAPGKGSAFIVTLPAA
jgi:PAS domain S-box-containing protein